MFIIDTPIHLWLCGNYTIDTKLFDENGKTITRHGYGGSVLFGSWIIATFFKNISYKVFSIGYPDFLQKEGPDLSNFFESKQEINATEAGNLTHYLLDYRSAIRKLQLVFFPNRIISFSNKSDISPNIIMLTPVYHELEEDSATKLKKLYPSALLSCDPQGWCRNKDSASNEIRIKEWIPSDQFLEAVSIIKMSLEDLRYSSKQDLEGFIERILTKGVILVITCGKKGNTCFFTVPDSNERECFFTPTKYLSEVGDTTGAGDVWLISFTIQYFISKNLKKSLATATILTSIKLQDKSLDNRLSSYDELKISIREHEHKIKSLSLVEGLRIIFST